MSFPRYPSYRDSGVEWLGEVPEHWDVLRIKHLVASLEQGWSPQCEGFPVQSEDEWGVLKVGCVNGGVFRPEENKTLPPELEPLPELGLASGDVLISRANTRELVGSAAVALRDYSRLMLCDKLYRLRLRADTCMPVFLAWYLGIPRVRGQIELSATGASSSMLNIGQSTIRELNIAIPPPDEQGAIATFLDRETAKIDALVAEQENLIGLLKEKRQAVISHAVTKGLDPSVPMKHSGVEWLGEVPAHWVLVSLKQVITRIESGTSVNAIDMPASSSELGVLKTSCVYSGHFDAHENKAVVPEEYDRVACPVKAGSLIVSRMNTPDLVGAAGVVHTSHENLFLPDRLWQVYFDGAHPDFVHHWTHTPIYRAQVEMACAGTSSSMQNLGQHEFRCFLISLPPLSEQTAIADFLDRVTAKINALIAEAQSASSLLQERRTALISAAVTGQIDVRQAMPIA